MNKLKVCVYGLGHLGQVTTACLAELGIEVTTLSNFENINEPNLQNLFINNKKRINYNNRKDYLLDKFDYIWFCFDTPVNGEDNANVQGCFNLISDIINLIDNEKIPIIVSSQLPVGTIAKLEKKHPNHIFACVPENLRHGTAIKNFLEPDRIVIGVRNKRDRMKYSPLFGKIVKSDKSIMACNKLHWTDIESAEMIKHAINSFLATCITWANEFGDICKKKGIDYNEILRGIQSEERIGNKLPLKTGKAYTGGTLARDIKYLIDFSGNKFFKTIRELNNKRLR